MIDGQRGPFAAVASSLGYFYQCRYALLEALRRLPDGESVAIGIETLDDVVFETTGSPVEILQTKHHLNSQVALTDSSSDLWRSLRIWIEGQDGGIIPMDAQFFLITTGVCSAGTAVAYLRVDGRDEGKALERLSSVASTSTNTSNSSAYRAFNDLSREQRAALLKSVTVLDSSPSLPQLDEQLRQAVFHAVDRCFLGPFLGRLEGWWYRRVLKHLLDDSAGPILGEEIEAEESRIRDQFRADNLPVDDDIMRATVDASGYQGRVFVEQLNLIGVNQNRVLHAIRNYYRAFEQRSRWLREDLLYVGDLDRYEERLLEEWEIMYQQMRDELGEEAASETIARAGRRLYNWVETGNHIPLRPAVTEPSIARGTYQMLADKLRVGWHLEFRDRLNALLSVGTDRQ